MKTLFTACALILTAGLAQADALDQIIDKKIKNSKVPEALIKSDGTVSVKFNGKTYKGTWEKVNGQYCRKIAAFKLDGCQNVVAIEDKDGKFIGVDFRDPGQDSGTHYFLK